MMSEELNALLPSLSPVDLKQLSRAQKVELVRQYRANNARNAKVMLFLATDLLAGGSGGLSATELYDLYEQVVVASLDCGKVDNARVYLNLLEKRFGRRSVRVNHLRGLCLEAEGKTAEARRLYEQLIKENPTDDFVVKRLSAMFKSEGKFKEAIRVLLDQEVYIDEDDVKHRFIEVHRGDALDVYRELSMLYYMTGNLEKAIFFTEEGILFEPDSYYLHTRLGELYYIKRDLGRCAVEYSQSLRLNQEPNNSRAAYGLYQVTSDMLRIHQSGVQKMDEEQLTRTKELNEFAADALQRMYAGSPVLSALDAYLQHE